MAKTPKKTVETRVKMYMKIIIVSGGSKGLGLGACRQLLKLGAAVLSIGRSKLEVLPEIQSLIHEYPNRMDYISADLLDEKASLKIIQKAIEKFGTIHGIIHCMLTPMEKLATVKTEALHQVLQLNLIAGLKLVQEALPELRSNQGTVILVSSGAATKPYPSWGPYCISKAALNMMAAVLGEEEKDVCTLAIRPGVVDTDMQKLIREQGRNIMPTELHKHFVSMKEEGKLVSPMESGLALAHCALNPKWEYSGKFLNWEDLIPKPSESA